NHPTKPFLPVKIALIPFHAVVHAPLTPPQMFLTLVTAPVQAPLAHVLISVHFLSRSVFVLVHFCVHAPLTASQIFLTPPTALSHQPFAHVVILVQAVPRSVLTPVQA